MSSSTQAAPTVAAGEGKKEEGRSSKRPKAAALPERRRSPASEALFIILERQRHAARAARAAARIAADREDEGLGPLGSYIERLCGRHDEDGDAGGIIGGGWHRAPAFFQDTNTGLCECPCTANRKPAPLPPEDALFFETCASAARVCKEWRALVFGAADRAVLSWEGHHMDDSHGRTLWRAGALGQSASKRLIDPAERLRAFEGGVLRALVVRGEPPPSAAAGRLRALARSAVDGSEEGIVGVLRQLRVLRLERSKAVLEVLAPLRCGWPRGQRPLLESLVTLDVGRWPDNGAPFAITRALFPSLRVLKVTLEDTATAPFDLWGGGDDDDDNDDDDNDAAPALTRLEVDTADFQTPTFAQESAFSVSKKTLKSLGSTLHSLRAARADWEDGPTELDRPMSRLAPYLTSLTHLTSLSLDGDYDLSPGSAQLGLWLQDSRSLLARLPDLRRLKLTDSPSSCGTVVLPPSISLLTRLTSLELEHYFIRSVGAGLRRLTGLKRLVLEQDEIRIEDDEDDEEEDDDDSPSHPPLLGRDLDALTSLTCLQLSFSAPCYAGAIESRLPRLSILSVECYVLPVAVAARVRLARSGGALEVCNGRNAMTLADLDAKITELSTDHEDAQDSAVHELKHQMLLAKVDSVEDQDAREAGAA